jgi:hypothetical protein
MRRWIERDIWVVMAVDDREKVEVMSRGKRREEEGKGRRCFDLDLWGLA